MKIVSICNKPKTVNKMKIKNIFRIGVLAISFTFLPFKSANSTSMQNTSTCLDEIMETVSDDTGCSMNYVPVVYSYLFTNGYTVYSIQMPDCENAYAQTVKNSISYTTHVYLTDGIVTAHEDLPN